MLEQLRLADVFVHYDDVQFSKGSFCNRVQVKTSRGVNWLTVPLKRHRLGERIEQLRPSRNVDWRKAHRDLLQQAYTGAPGSDEMLALLDQVYADDEASMADISRRSMVALAEYFGLARGTEFVDVAQLGVDGSGSERVRNICRKLGADTYVTGHGGRRYLEHEQFEASGIAVRYMDYRLVEYPQLHGEFTPYVSALDLVANMGREGARVICSETVDWKRFVHGSD